MITKVMNYLVDHGFTPAAAKFVLGLGAFLVLIVLVGTCSVLINGSQSSIPTDDAGGGAKGDTIYITAIDRPMMVVEPNNPGYEKLFNLVGGDGSHKVSDERWLEAMATMGWGTTTPEREAELDAEQARWTEQWDHRDNINAFVDQMTAINADRVIDRTELERICFLRQQWEVQLTAARDYVMAYRRDEPELVAKNPGLESLQEQAERGLIITESARQDCR